MKHSEGIWNEICACYVYASRKTRPSAIESTHLCTALAPVLLASALDKWVQHAFGSC